MDLSIILDAKLVAGEAILNIALMILHETLQTGVAGVVGNHVEHDLGVMQMVQIVTVDGNQTDIQEHNGPCAVNDGVDHADEGTNGTPGAELDDGSHHHRHQRQDSTDITNNLEQNLRSFQSSDLLSESGDQARMGFRAAARTSF